MPTLWVPIIFDTQITLTDITYTVETDLAAHLFLAYSPPKPRYSRRYKRTRGLLIPCGYIASWENSQCTEQQEPGATTTHTFVIPRPTTAQRLNLALATSCPITEGIPATPPIQTDIIAPAIPNASITLGTNVDQAIVVSSQKVTWHVVLAQTNWQHDTTPGTIIRCNDTAVYMDADYSIDHTQSLAGDWETAVQDGFGSHNYYFQVDTFPAGGPFNQAQAGGPFTLTLRDIVVMSRRINPFSGAQTVLAGSTITVNTYD